MTDLPTMIQGHLAALAESLSHSPAAGPARCLALGGGYGRGDGGQTPEGTPYNDYDLVLVHDGGRDLIADWCRWANACGPRFGLHVDVTPIAAARLAVLPPALTWYELGHGHVVLWGDRTALAPLGLRTLADVDPSEWGRLLLNRACGLCFAAWEQAGITTGLRGDEPLAAFATRQVEKAWLALGDAELARRGAYHHRLAARVDAWTQQADPPPWRERWLASARWKRRPIDYSIEQCTVERAALGPLLVEALSNRAVDRRRPAIDLARTLRDLPPRRWMGPRGPRERLRQAVIAELSGDVARREHLVGSPAELVRLWSRCG